jgi:hypothetical protein
LITDGNPPQGQGRCNERPPARTALR